MYLYAVNIKDHLAKIDEKVITLYPKEYYMQLRKEYKNK